MSNEWMDIETAPKDGTEILIYDDSCFCVVQLNKGKWHSTSCIDYYNTYDPTHWMPLPEAPNE